jgi:hypothetical protein
MSFTISDVNIATPLTTSTKEEQHAVVRFAWDGGVELRMFVETLSLHSLFIQQYG